MRCRIEAHALASRVFLLPMIVLAWYQLYGIANVSAMGSPTVVAVDPEVRRAITTGPARVLVELRVPPDAQSAEEFPTLGAAPGGAIALAQRAVLSQLPSAHFSLVRQFATVPFLALEVDADALTALENLGAHVTRIVADRPLMPAARP